MKTPIENIKDAALIKIQSKIDVKKRQLETAREDLDGFVDESTINKVIASRTRQLEVLKYILESIIRN
jgi:hypothetical protein